jgi:GNAT superfamily N-acetyltransferase
MNMPNIVMCPWSPKRDSIADVTLLLHRAYGEYVPTGIEFGAATQGADVTRARIETATATWIASSDGKLVGTFPTTITGATIPNRSGTRVPRWDTSVKFAIEPEKQGCGIGRQLLTAVEERAAKDGKRELSCDTAVDLENLVSFYERMGYCDVGRHRWPHADFETIVRSKTLESPAT